MSACLLPAVLISVVALTARNAAHADPGAPVDVVPSGAQPLPIPRLPTGFMEEQVGDVTWGFHTSATELAGELQAKLPAAWRKVTTELGAKVSGKMVVRIARGPKDMVRLAPQGAPPPSYAVGVAYPALGLVILSVVDPGSWLPPDLSPVLTHELSHLALHRAVKGHALPRWFTEGLAIHQAGEQNLKRVQTLWEAAVVDEVLPLSALSANFPARPHEVNRAYAQSADLVQHMLRDANDRERLPILLGHLASGMAFDQAVLAAYHIDLPYLDREWRQALGERFRVLPLVLTGTAVWGGIALLSVLAFVRRRQDHRAKLARWAEEEAAHERAMQALALQRQSALREEWAREAGVVAPLPTESGVPTIEHDGHRYTLH